MAKLTYTAIEGFCGAGGLSMGVERAGFRLAYAFDNDPVAIATHRRNLKSLADVEDASGITGRELLDKAQLESVDLVAGGPPCQGFSKQKRGAHLGDPRNWLVVEFARLVSELGPRFLLLENVAMLGKKRGREFLATVRRHLPNYQLTPAFYNSADYGVAQKRRRFILVGQREDVNAVFQVPGPTIERWPTVRDAIGDLPEPPMDYSVHPQYPNHQRARVTPINIERFSHVKQGGGWQDIPKHLRLPCHRNVDTSSGGWPDVYGRLEWTSQCPTITGGFDSFTRGRYGHPEHDRPLTPREAARLQGFPDWFVFEGNRGDVRRQIGNAVPPSLGEAVCREIIRCLEESDGLRVRRPISQPGKTLQLQLL